MAAAFNTPLAGVAFAIEELANSFEQRVALLVMTAIVVAGIVSLGIAGDYVYFGTMPRPCRSARMLVIAPVAGVIGGLSGGLFARAGARRHVQSRPLPRSAGKAADRLGAFSAA